MTLELASEAAFMSSVACLLQISMTSLIYASTEQTESK